MCAWLTDAIGRRQCAVGLRRGVGRLIAIGDGAGCMQERDKLRVETVRG